MRNIIHYEAYRTISKGPSTVGASHEPQTLNRLGSGGVAAPGSRLMAYGLYVSPKVCWSPPLTPAIQRAGDSGPLLYSNPRTKWKQKS